MKNKGYWKRVLAHILCVCMVVLTVCGTNVSTVQATESASESLVDNVENVMESSTETVTEDSDEDFQEADNREEDTSKEEETEDVKETSEEKETAETTEEFEIQEAEADIVLLAEEETPKAAEPAVIYFLNSKGWEEVGAYIYGDKGALLGDWGNTIAESADELGGDWLKVSVSDVPPYSIIFYNKAAETERAELYLETEEHIYVTAEGKAYTSQSEAEMEMGITSDASMVYFYNGQKWAGVGAYIYGDKGELLGGWGNASASSAPEMGENWMKIAVPGTPAYSIIFYNQEADAERVELYVEDEEHVYISRDGNAYTSKEEALEAWKEVTTTVYFINSNHWENVYAYAYENEASIANEWPGNKAVSAESELGEGWWKVTFSKNAAQSPFTVIFNNGKGEQIKDINITNFTKNYATGNGEIYSSQTDAEESVGIVYETIVYALNNKDWENTGAYIWGDCGEALGSWPGTVPEAAPEIGEKWLKVSVPAKLPFNFIFFDMENQSDRTEMLLSNEQMLYVTGAQAAFGSAFEAEASVGMVDESELLVVYFYNSEGWGDINAYAYRDSTGAALGTAWPGASAELAPEIGDNWWKAVVPIRKTDISEENVIGFVFNDGVNQTNEDCLITDNKYIFFAVDSVGYATAEEAEEAAAKYYYDDGCEDGPNKDFDNYEANLSGAGADLPFVAYEAEAAKTNGEVLEKDTTYIEAIQSEASGRQAVVLDETGEYVEFTLTKPANALVLRYSIPNTSDGCGQDATLSCYVDGVEKQNLEVTSRYSWLYGAFPYTNDVSKGKPKRFYDEIRVLFDEIMPAGTKLKLQKDAGDTADNYIIDLIELENVAAPNEQPQNSLSITDFGAIANDGMDDRAALDECIAQAKKEKKEVWIPAGTFNLEEEKGIEATAVTIRGAGMWHSNLVGAGASFFYSGTSKFYDFSMTGVSTVRDDKGDLAGFEGKGRSTNVTIENIWMEHMKVGIWSYNTTNLVVQGCRIRNTYADGINLCSATHNAVVRNNHLRNTGDDCLAIWPWLGDCTNNTFAYNTIQVPTLANGIAIYGGAGNTAEYNHVSDTIVNGGGICVGTEFETNKPFTGTTTVRYNLLERCGSDQCDEKYPIGAIWVWASERFRSMEAVFNIHDNTLKDCTNAGVLLEGKNIMTGVTLKNIKVDGATHAVQELFDQKGSGVAMNITATNLRGEFHNDGNPNFDLKWVENKPGNSNGSNNSNAGNNDSASITVSKPTAALTVIEPQNMPLAEQIVESADIPYVNIAFETKEAVLKLEQLKKYHGRNLYLMAYVGDGIGYTIENEELGKAKEDLVLGSSMEEVADFTADFDTFQVQPVQEKQLFYEIGLHMNVGAEFAGKTAYLFSKNLVTGNYQFIKAMTVSEIGNVALKTNEITNVMILIAR